MTGYNRRSKAWSDQESSPEVFHRGLVLKDHDATEETKQCFEELCQQFPEVFSTNNEDIGRTKLSANFTGAPVVSAAAVVQACSSLFKRVLSSQTGTPKPPSRLG